MEKEYTIDDIKVLKWYESVRLRPSMYIGNTDNKGFANILKGVFSSIIVHYESDIITINLTKSLSGNISFSKREGSLKNKWQKWRFDTANPYFFEIPVLNALSTRFEARLLNTEGGIIAFDIYEKGVLQSELQPQSDAKGVCIEMFFTLDNSIWKNNFAFNRHYISYAIQEFAFLNKNVHFSLLFEGVENSISK